MNRSKTITQEGKTSLKYQRVLNSKDKRSFKIKNSSLTPVTDRFTTVRFQNNIECVYANFDSQLKSSYDGRSKKIKTLSLKKLRCYEAFFRKYLLEQ
uniref:Orf 7 n=1 Tax=Cauliflower mosaic virus TaxID=10641 RepID=A0A059SRK5_9VIRU|nr:orf 7 [Cauliflower mosaic virus]